MLSRPSNNAWKLLISGIRGIFSIQFSTCTIPKRGNSSYIIYHISSTKRIMLYKWSRDSFRKGLCTWTMEISFWIMLAPQVLSWEVDLINSVLDAIPTYRLSIVHVTQSVVQRLDKIKRNFTWQVNKEKKEFHLVQ